MKSIKMQRHFHQLKLLEHLIELKILTFFASKTWFNFIKFMKHADGCSEHNHISDEVSRTILSTFYFNIWDVHLLQQLSHLSGTVFIYFLRTSTLMLSHAFCNSSLRFSFERTIDLSSLFFNSPWNLLNMPSFLIWPPLYYIFECIDFS